MMRMMRKMFKRIVSIVMALLVILGTAGYGGSVFAEGAQEQADSASVTFSDDYIYLDPTGMKSEGADWTTNSDTKVYIRFTDAQGGDPKKGTYDNGIWKFPVSNFPNYGNSRFYFTYIGGTNDDWGQINGHDYYRTAESTLTVDQAKGSVVVQNGTTTMDGRNVYTIAVKKSYAGNTLSFVDMTGTLTGIQAQFSLDGNYDDSASEQVTARQKLPLSDGKVTVPSDVNGEAYQYVRFIDAQSKAVTDFFDLAKAISKGGILYYGIRQDSSKIYSEWSQEKKSETAPAVTKLYFNNLSFKTSDEITIQIGSGEPVKVVPDDTATNTLSYSISGNNIDKDTIISITKKGVTYRFYPNGTDNLITYSGSNICIKGTYQADLPNTNTVYFDATLSKLSYAGDVVDNSIPLKNSKIYCHAWNDTSDSYDGVLTKLDDFSDGTHTWSDVYKAELDKKYSHILFYSSTDGKIPSDNASKTYDLNIPANLTNPCFYADTSDDSIYKGTKRSGYWGELYTVRDAEGKTKDGDTTTTSGTIVDIPSGTLTRNSDMLYVNTTLYDYYSDYELNGYNRDGYSYNAYLKDLGNNPNLHYIYQPFRQFDQALSSYYDDNSASSPIYWGNFQNYNGSHYSEISDSLKLYGSNNWNKFIYENNSMWGRNAVALSDANSAVQGLVADTLSNNNLMIKASGKTVAAPYFNEDFLAGNNSKNTVLGKVYNDVTFPFVKKKVTSNSYKGSVDYWCFNSADANASNKNLQLQQSEEDGYFLNPSGQDVKGQTVNQGYPQTSDNNYFPFNTIDQSGNATKLNYGFGQKFDLKFKLTSDGTVTTDKKEKVPIEFNFSGDDDVWVFIDGKLVLDVGGGHGKVTGTINFKDKKATVSSVKNDDVTKGGATQNVEKEFENVKEITDDYFTKEHTLTMFYMERGLWESNMSISFNFPDENEFAVEKKVDTTDVNTKLFPISLFKDASVFPFTIQNQATHYAPKPTQSSDAKRPKIYNNSFLAEKLSKTFPQNTFETTDEKAGQTNVVHWKAKSDDAEGEHINKRFGIIRPADGETFDASDTNAFLQFKMYYDYPDIPGLTSTYLELEDADGNKINGYLSGKTYGNSSLVHNQWNTIQVDLSKLQGDKKFEYSKIKNIKFNYNFERDIYLDDFIFIPSVVAATKTGFVTQQQDIPDYGSATSGTLKYPEGAQYTLSKNDGSSKLYRIGSDGIFALADGETATFSDQFRRGSYIAVSEDVNSSVFDTTWTLYENGQAVSTMGTGETVENEDPIPLVKNVKGNTIQDGRKEEYKSGQNNSSVEISNNGYSSTGYAKNQDSGKTENKNTIVFRSYVAPDNQTTMTKLKATFVNKVKTGKIEIRKETAEGSNALNGDYTFRVEFSNVADLSLESKKIVKDYTIKAGQSVTIDGIPAGTDYRISEINSSDGSTLESVIVNNNNSFDAGYDPVTKVVAGKVIASSDMKDGADATIITFKNTLKPTINLNLTKVWNNINNITLPDSIKIQLQRSKDKGTTWETVKYDGKNKTITLSQGYDGKWSYSFKDLDQYVDYKADPKVPYIYRVVEVSGDDGSEKVIESGGYLNDKYKVTYSENVDCSKISTEPPESKTQSFTITNTYSPKTNIKITKQDASTKKPLDGVEFKLEKMKKDTSTNKLVVDNSFETKPVTTGESSNPSGIAEFKDLEDGTYRLTETKAAENHSLLKDPVIIVINRNGKSLIDNEVCEVVDNTISITISNQARFNLPATGGYGRYIVILGGIALAVVGLFMYRLQKRRKEGNIS